MQDNSSALDRSLILDTLCRYAWGYDEGDFEMLAQAFTADGRSAGKVSNSDISWGPMIGRDQIVGVLSDIRRSQVGQRRHTVHTPRFESLTADRADLATYMVVFNSHGGQTNVVTSGWYRARLVRESDGVWRIKNLDVLLDSPF